MLSFRPIILCNDLAVIFAIFSNVCRVYLLFFALIFHCPSGVSNNSSWLFLCLAGWLSVFVKFIYMLEVRNILSFCSLLNLLQTFVWLFTRKSRMLRASLPSSGRPSVRLSVCPSVRPSVTLVSCIKTVQARITKSSPWTAPRSLVYRDKISCHRVQGFPSNEGVEEGYPP